MTMQYYTQLTQAFAMVVKEKVGPMRELVLQEIRGAREIMARLYQTHEVRDLDEILPDVDEILAKHEEGGGRNLGNVTGGQAEPGGGPDGESGVENLFAPLAAGTPSGPGGGGNGASAGQGARGNILAGASG